MEVVRGSAPGAGLSAGRTGAVAARWPARPPKSGRPVHAASVEYRYRAPHTAFGRSGYSQVWSRSAWNRRRDPATRAVRGVAWWRVTWGGPL